MYNKSTNSYHVAAVLMRLLSRLAAVASTVDAPSVRIHVPIKITALQTRRRNRYGNVVLVVGLGRFGTCRVTTMLRFVGLNASVVRRGGEAVLSGFTSDVQVVSRYVVQRIRVHLVHHPVDGNVLGSGQQRLRVVVHRRRRGLRFRRPFGLGVVRRWRI